MILNLQRIIFYLTIILFFFLPLHAWGVTWLPIPFFWKELILVVLLGLWGIVIFLDWRSWDKVKRSWQKNKKLLHLMIVVWLCLLFATRKLLFFSFFLENDYSWQQFFYALRTDFIGWVVLIFFLFYSFSPQEKRVFWKVSLGVSSIVVVLWFIQFFNPWFFTYFGYSELISSWTPGITKLPLYHGLSADSDLVRVNSTFSSPNHLAAYLLLLSSFIFYFLLTLKNKKIWEKKELSAISIKRINGIVNFLKIMGRGYLLLVMGLLFLTFSRSAWLGFWVMIGVFCLVYYRSWLGMVYQKNRLLWLGALVTLGVVAMKWGQKLISVRELSSSEHLQKTIEGVRLLSNNWWGLGMGAAWPVSVRFDPNFIGIVPENWFLQIGLEIGIIGLIFYLLIYGLIGKRLWVNFRENNSRLSFCLLLSYLGISVMACFLHIWENVPMTMLWFMWAGMSLNNE